MMVRCPFGSSASTSSVLLNDSPSENDAVTVFSNSPLRISSSVIVYSAVVETLAPAATFSNTD